MSGLPTLAEQVRGRLAAALDALGPGLCDVAAEEVVAAADTARGLSGTAVVAEAPYDGADGVIALVLTVGGARRLAALTGAIDEEEAEGGGAAPAPAEIDAARDLIAQLAPALAATAADVLRLDVAAGAPTARAVADPAALATTFAAAPDAVLVPFTLLGEPSRLVVSAPEGALAAEGAPARAAQALSATPLRPALHAVSVRVWAELGRTRMPTGRLVGLPAGTIVDLDRDADDAVDLYVDGQRYATGRLVVTDDESWGVRIERVLAHGA